MTDILAIAAHPDDVELIVSGTLLKASDAGESFAICDLTEGERGSRGTRETRREETRNANRILGIPDELRINLGIPDGNIEITKENTLKLVRVIRHFRPRVILFPWERDRHPDHEHSHRLVREAYFDAGLPHVKTEWEGQAQEPYRPERMYCFFHTYERQPDFVVDVTDQVERKLDAIAAYTTQFTVPGRQDAEAEGPQTFISHPEFIESALARMRHWGFMVGVKYAEAYTTVSGPLKVNDLLETL